MTLTLLALALLPVADPAGDEFFETNVRPVLVEHCVTCHGPTKQQGGVRLDGRDFLVKTARRSQASATASPTRSGSSSSARPGTP